MYYMLLWKVDWNFYPFGGIAYSAS